MMAKRPHSDNNSDNQPVDSKHAKKHKGSNLTSEVLEYLKKASEKEDKLIDLSIKQAEEDLEIKKLKKQLLQEQIKQARKDH